MPNLYTMLNSTADLILSTLPQTSNTSSSANPKIDEGLRRGELDKVMVLLGGGAYVALRGPRRIQLQSKWKTISALKLGGKLENSLLDHTRF
jgi:hypothetical protein